jgi:hypothetical protein
MTPSSPWMTTGTFRPGDYTAEEVQGLVWCYLSVCMYKHRLPVLLRCADLERCFPRLPTQEREAVALHGMMGHSCESIGDGGTGSVMKPSDSATTRACCTCAT